jgi:addiction module RelB/DinJ family antitoxin
MTTTLRIDDVLKRDCDDVFGRLGMSMTSAITVFLKQVVRTRRIPFEISCADYHESKAVSISPLSSRRRDALMAIEEIRADRIARNEREWTLDEINAEIASARSDRRKHAVDGAIP